MALIRSFHTSSQHIRRHQTEVDYEHTVVGSGTDRVLHLSTFGSDARASNPKSSQSIQLDRERAQELVRIIHHAFPNLERA